MYYCYYLRDPFHQRIGCVVFTPGTTEETVTRGISFCSHGDRWDTKKGKAKAQGRCFRALNRKFCMDPVLDLGDLSLEARVRLQPTRKRTLELVHRHCAQLFPPPTGAIAQIYKTAFEVPSNEVERHILRKKLQHDLEKPQ